MTYVRKTWQNDKAGGTQITAEELDRIEQGIADAFAAIAGIDTGGGSTGLEVVDL